MAASNNGLLQDANDGGCLGQANHRNIQQGDQGTDNYRDSMSQDKIIVSCMSWSRYSPSLGCFDYMVHCQCSLQGAWILYRYVGGSRYW